MKLKSIHRKRLEKLIAFLRQLPRKRFNFAIVRNEPPKCGAVGCAIGYTPNVFPRTIKSVESPDREWTHGVCFHGGNDSDFEGIASWMCGLADPWARWLFEPGCQSAVHSKLSNLYDDATPKQVARMLEKFIKLHS